MTFHFMFGPEDERNLMSSKNDTLISGSTATDTIYFGAAQPAQDYWYEDGISLTGNPYSVHDTTTFNYNMTEDTNKNGFWKYNEDKILKQLEEYIEKLETNYNEPTN